jgi:hypothetical protein
MATVTIKKDSRMEIEVTDWRFLVRELRKVDRKLVAKFKTKAREIGKPVENAIKSGIPNKFPITGMKPKVVPGRVTWGAVQHPKKTSLKVDTRIKRKNGGTSIVSVWVWSPATIIADLAKNERSNGRLTREYEYSLSPTGTRRHRINGQGAGMIQALNKSGLPRKTKPSRMVYPSAAKALPVASTKMTKLIDEASQEINATMRTGAN